MDVVQRQVGLAAEGGVPEIGILVAIDTGRAADDMLAGFGDKQLAPVRFAQFDKELAVRDVSFWLKPMVMAQQFVEGLQVLFRFHRLAGHATCVGHLDAVHHLFRNPFLGGLAVQGVVDAHPVDGEIVVVAEVAVAKHLLGEVTDFDVKSFGVQSLRQCCQHLPEKFVLFVVAFGIGTFAHHPAVHEDERGNEGGTVADRCQQLADHPSRFIGTDHHIGLHLGRGGTDEEQLAAVEEVAFLHLRQLVRTAVYDSLYSFHG